MLPAPEGRESHADTHQPAHPSLGLGAGLLVGNVTSPFILSLLVTLAAAPAVRWLMLRRDVIDIPTARSSHTNPTPRGGGLACIVGVVAAMVVAGASGLEVRWPLIGAAVALSLVGLLDDSRGLGAISRLTAQAVAGGAMGWAAGGGWLIGAGAAIALVVVNSVNFMDGINGITSLSVAVWGATAWLVGLAAGANGLWVIGAATAGAALGFLPWNAPHARLFLGDTGSYLFGALIVGGIIVGLSRNASPLVLAAPLVIYLADTGSVLVLRASRGEPLMTAHRGHVYQLLTRDPRVPHILVSTLVALLAAIVTVAVARAPLWAALSLSAVICAAYVTIPRVAVRRAEGSLRPAGDGR